MALKYYFEFTDVKEVLHRCEISDENFTGDATLVYGNLATNKANTKDALELAREEDTPRDVEIRILLALVVRDLDVLRGEEYGETI